jgi:hypothetical protein
MPALLDVMVFAVPVVLAAALSYGFRRRGAIAHLLIWLAGFPVLYVLTVALTLLISFQVFGVDLVD